MKDVSLGDIFRFLGYTFILVSAFSCGKTTGQVTSDDNNCFLYKDEYRALYLRNCDFSKMPDSIASKDIRQLAINSFDLIDFEALSKQIDLGKITNIRIDDLNQLETNLDLAKFKRLKSISVFGGDNVTTINLTNVGDSLTSLTLHAPQLTFPQFDSAFLDLTDLYYGGQSEVIPKWIESLNRLQSFHFDAKDISEIKCDVCKMDSLFEFDIVNHDVVDKELYLSKMTVYPTILKIKKCKPDLRFWNVLPPY